MYPQAGSNDSRVLEKKPNYSVWNTRTVQDFRFPAQKASPKRSQSPSLRNDKDDSANWTLQAASGNVLVPDGLRAKGTGSGPCSFKEVEAEKNHFDGSLAGETGQSCIVTSIDPVILAKWKEVDVPFDLLKRIHCPGAQTLSADRDSRNPRPFPEEEIPGFSRLMDSYSGVVNFHILKAFKVRWCILLYTDVPHSAHG